MRVLLVCLAALATLGALAQPARAENITVGLFAPSAPFPSTAARVELATKLGEHLGKALGGNGIGKVYARAADFAAAVKKGEITIALVDASYLGTTSVPFAVVAQATRGGDTLHAWQLVARGAEKIAQLKGKRVLVPSVGGRETDFVLNVLLGGEVARDFFGKIEAAPDTASTLAALGLGKAEVAVVPASVDLPGGAMTVLRLPSLPGAVLVVYGAPTAAQKANLLAAATSFKGDATVAGFKGGDTDDVRSVARRYSVPVKRGPIAVPAVRLVVGDLLEGRTLAIERTPVTAFALAPPSR